jgi:hypothetical protein
MDTQSTADTLGPHLYGEDVHNTPALVYTWVGAAFFVLGVLLCFIPPDPQGPANAMLVGGSLVAGLGALFLIVGLVRLLPNRGASWHVHERGIRLARRNGERVIEFTNVDVLTLKVVRVFFHGVCTGEVTDATFQAQHNKVILKQVRRPTSAPGAGLDRPGALAQACDKVAELIAGRMADRLRRGEPIAWIKATHIHPDGLAVPRSGEDRIPWSEIENVAIEQGVFQLWRRGTHGPVFKAPAHLPNLFPGYRLIADRVQGNVDNDHIPPPVNGG